MVNGKVSFKIIRPRLIFSVSILGLSFSPFPPLPLFVFILKATNYFKMRNSLFCMYRLPNTHRHTPHQTHYWALACFIAIIAIKTWSKSLRFSFLCPRSIRSICCCCVFHSFIQNTRKAFNERENTHTPETQKQKEQTFPAYIHTRTHTHIHTKLLWKG